MGVESFPPQGADPLTSLNVMTTSQMGWGLTTLSAPNDAITVGTAFGQVRSGTMVSLSGTHSGMRVVFEALTIENVVTYRTWSAWHMTQGVWLTQDWLPNNAPATYWIPSNGATSVRLRVANIVSGSAAGGFVAMHAPASLGTGPIGKLDWSLMVSEQVPGNNVNVMQNHSSATQTLLVARTIGLNTSYPIPSGKRLRIHSYAGSFLAGAAGGRCQVGLRSNLTGPTIGSSDLLGAWSFGPSAGGTNPDERWSGVASTLTEPIDIYNNGAGASVGISAMGSPGTSGKLTFTLFGYLVGY